MTHIDWSINPSVILAALAIFLSQRNMHRVNIDLITEMKTKVNAMWTIFMKDHHIRVGEDE